MLALQAAIWEVVEETEAGPLGLNNGSFSYGWGGDQAAIDLANDWLAALSGTKAWSDDYAFDYELQKDLFIFTALDGNGNLDPSISRTMIGYDVQKKKKPQKDEEFGETPEPASALIFGLGTVLGVPVVRFVRRRRKNAGA